MTHFKFDFEPGRALITVGKDYISAELTTAGNLALLVNGELIGEVTPSNLAEEILAADEGPIQDKPRLRELLSTPPDYYAWDLPPLEETDPYDAFIAAHGCRVCDAHPATDCGHVCTFNPSGHVHCPTTGDEVCQIEHSHCTDTPPF